MSNHPITPPPELVQQWIKDWTNMVHQWALVKDDKDAEKPLGPSEYAATQAARWGADQELEACCEWFAQDWSDTETAAALRATRRPKPPSLKEQALSELDSLENMGVCNANTIRRALEALPDE